jgi:tetratricopeptide (TPR) repeat protein
MIAFSGHLAKFLEVLCALLLMTSFGSIALSQDVQATGQIIGFVTDPQGHALTGVRIMLLEIGSNREVGSCLTDTDGRYALAMQAGSYTIVASFSGFARSQVDVVIKSSTATESDIRITPGTSNAPGAVVNRSFGGVEKQAPTFSPSGVQGTIAPSGYSAAASAEQTSQVMDHVGALSTDALAPFLINTKLPACDRQDELLHEATAHPDRFDSNYNLGAFYLGHGNFGASIHFLEIALQIKPNDLRISRDLALAYTSAMRYSEAIVLLRRIAGVRQGDSELLTLLALAYELAGQPANSAKEYLAAASQSQDVSDATLFASGIGLIRVGATDDAAKLFTSGTREHPAAAKLWMGLGIAQSLLQQKGDAIQSIFKAIQLDPEYLPPYSFLTSLFGTSPVTDAEISKRLETLVVAQPEKPMAHYDYALALWTAQRSSHTATGLEEIQSQLKLALVQNPRLFGAHYQLGIVYAESGDFARSAQELQEAVRLEPDNAEAHYRLAQALRRTKQNSLADAELQEFQILKRRGEDGAVSVQRLTREFTERISQPQPCETSSY